MHSQAYSFLRELDLKSQFKPLNPVSQTSSWSSNKHPGSGDLVVFCNKGRLIYLGPLDDIIVYTQAPHIITICSMFPKMGWGPDVCQGSLCSSARYKLHVRNEKQ